MTRHNGHALLFPDRHRLERRPEAPSAPSLDFDKHEGVAVPRDEVYLPARATVVPREDTVPLASQESLGKLLSPFPEFCSPHAADAPCGTGYCFLSDADLRV